MKVLYFGMEGCCQCHALQPKIEKACKEHNIEMQVIDCEEQEDLAAQYKIRNVPFAVLFNDNEEITFMGRAADLLPKIS